MPTAQASVPENMKQMLKMIINVNDFMTDSSFWFRHLPDPADQCPGSETTPISRDNTLPAIYPHSNYIVF
jgi:hypothetical protein